MYKQLTFGDEARGMMYEGVRQLANAVKATLGPRGRNVVINRPSGPFATKDGVTVAKEIRFSDPWWDMGATMVREVASLSNRQAGDGTTTATVLAEAILRYGLEAIEGETTAGRIPDTVAIKRGIDEGVKKIIEYMRQFVVPCDDLAALRDVALISANGDEVIADLIIEALRQTNGGMVVIEEGSRQEDQLIVTSGLEFDRGFYNEFFSNSKSGHPSWRNEKVRVVLFDGKAEFQPHVAAAMTLSTKHPVLFIAREFSDEVLTGMVNLNSRQGRICPLRAPGFGDETIRHLKDIAMISGGMIYNADTLPTEVEKLHSGELAQVTVFKDKTMLVADRREDEEYMAYLDGIRELIEKYRDEDNQFMVDRFGRRLAMLSGGLGLIRVGGRSEFEMKERHARVVDAISAVGAAKTEGIHTGGGYPLMRAAGALMLGEAAFRESLVGRNNVDGIVTGYRILLTACQEPFRAILANAGEHKVVDEQISDAVITEAWEKEAWETGFNAAAGRVENLVQAGVIDPFRVTRSAVENAASVAGLMLTTECMITDERTSRVAVEDFAMRR